MKMIMTGGMITHRQEDESSGLCFLINRSETDGIPPVVGLIAEEHEQYFEHYARARVLYDFLIFF